MSLSSPWTTVCCLGLLACGEVPAGDADREAPESVEVPSRGVAAVDVPPRPPLEQARSGCPVEMVEVDHACIDRYEAHLVTRGPDGARVRHPYFLRPEAGVVYEARSEAGVFPQAYISRVESAAACGEAGKRLCSRAEWQGACGRRADGGAPTIFPYGNRAQAQRCNSDKPHLLTLRFGPDARRWHYEDFNDPALDQEPGFLALTGAYDGCVSDAGAYDLVGNLHEWVADTADAAFEARLRGEGVSRAFQYWSPGNGVFMGGFFSTQGELGPGCTYTTIAHDAGYHDYSTGFRCCADAG